MEDALVFALRIQEITYSAIYNEIFAKSTRKPPQKMARDGASLVNSCVNRSQSSVTYRVSQKKCHLYTPRNS